MTSDNSATVKIIANMTREYNALLEKSNNKLKEYRDLLTDHKKLGNKFMFLKRRHETLMEVHEKTLKNEYNLTDKLKEQRREIVEDLGHIFSCQSLSCVEIRCGEIRVKWEERLPDATGRGGKK